ncbi:hypothetical protein QWY77_12820 [Thalassotalea ponticola]|uniref:hypothetical protein n=1 Tax=Thalassotalea ponticola TaxID=1523392 RepID=UPI0025B3F22E|nr:hypothetical protein [Thalassotalea ponticola]MDN3653628.1 hypothetical protein [Thalassotalea ponticola]
MFLKTFIEQESKIFALAPTVYALALFLATFGFTTCVWNIVELLQWIPFAYSFLVTGMVSLSITIAGIAILQQHRRQTQPHH